MKDSFGREINYLRISVTKRCNLNCSYCGSKREAFENELTIAEIRAVTEAFSDLGIKKVRLTGGEPLMREDIVEIAREIKSIKGIETLYITTNGIRLEEMAESLKDAGVDGINISLDTVNKETYYSLSGVDGLEKVLRGIKKALRLGFSSLKINSVLIRGKNDSEAESLLSLPRCNRLDLRFIELMPFSGQGEREELVVTNSSLLEKFPFLKKCPDEEGAAVYYTAKAYMGRVGFISPRSNKFCSSCNRVRLLSDGRIKLCLGNELTVDIREYINDSELLREKIREAILLKPSSHHFEDGESFRGLNLIGG